MEKASKEESRIDEAEESENAIRDRLDTLDGPDLEEVLENILVLD